MKYTRLVFACSSVALTSCADDPMTFMRSYSAAEHSVTALGWGATILCVAVVVIISVLVLVALFHRRPVLEASDAGTHIERSGTGVGWIYVGVGISTLVLIVLYCISIVTYAAAARPARKASLTIEIKAHQWWWEARYDDGKPEDTFITANELHIPLHTPVQLKLESSDVIHSFWIPQLAGKTDVIPGQSNRMWIEADSAATYRGQCAEYCGLQHAHMAMEVVAESEADFRSWWGRQAATPSKPNDDAAQQGLDVFRRRCSACHTVRGTDGAGIVGPDLTHVMSRATIAAASFPNTRGYLAGWITDAQGMKAGSQMPTLSLPPHELQAVLAYIETLN
jgi:cytochrome c oxidase subunit II